MESPRPTGYNVSINGPNLNAVDVEIDDWNRTILINATSVILMSKYAIPVMRRQSAGSIVNVASIGGLAGGHPGVAYSASNGGVVNLTRAMAGHHGAEGIRVNCVAPGLVYTPMAAGNRMKAHRREARRLRGPLRTEGLGWDVAHAVVYLSSDEARWITGVVLPVDAGLSAIMADLPTA